MCFCHLNSTDRILNSILWPLPPIQIQALASPIFFGAQQAYQGIRGGGWKKQLVLTRKFIVVKNFITTIPIILYHLNADSAKVQ